MRASRMLFPSSLCVHSQGDRCSGITSPPPIIIIGRDEVELAYCPGITSPQVTPVSPPHPSITHDSEASSQVC